MQNLNIMHTKYGVLNIDQVSLMSVFILFERCVTKNN